MSAALGTILYVDNYTVDDGPSAARSSDSIGYGRSASKALRDGLKNSGWRVVRPTVQVSGHHDEIDYRSRWILASYTAILNAVLEERPDAIFCFHAFGPFPSEIRRFLLDLNLTIPIIGYTHGSHWDPTDVFRFEHYPNMHVADLGNLFAMDRVLLVSEYIRETILANVFKFSPSAAADLEQKLAVVGLPIDCEGLDACRVERKHERPTVVFNHAFNSGKDPDLFLQVIDNILDELDVNVLFTRRAPAQGPTTERLQRVTKRFGERILLGDDMSLTDYYRALWAADIQVSTARHESLGVATLEAMYTENYCIVPRLGSYPEILGKNYQGLYPRSDAALADRLRFAVHNPTQRSEVARSLRASAARYSTSAVTPKITAELEKMLANV